jgi:hypothetical protein
MATSNGSRSLSDPHRQALLHQARQLDSRAADAAAKGDLSTSARLILESLDCERRAGGLGPQVLQLIKPRS